MEAAPLAIALVMGLIGVVHLFNLTVFVVLLSIELVENAIRFILKWIRRLISGG